jgi:hypothetical protein
LQDLGNHGKKLLVFINIYVLTYVCSMLHEVKLVPADVDAEKVLRILNRSFSSLQDESTKPKYKALASDFGIRPEMAPLVDIFATEELRRLVDNWIDSGREPNGMESPYKRSYADAQDAWDAWKIYFREFANFEPVLSKDGTPLLRFEPKSWERMRARWSAQWREQLRFYAKEIGFPVMSPKDPENEMMLIYRVNSWIQHFSTAILLSDLRLRIAKCRYRKCRRPYFLFPALPRKRPYTGGLFCCTTHNRAESAMKGMKRRRAEADKHLLEWAAQELSREPRTDPDTRVKEKLVIYLNKRIAGCSNRTREQIRINWVTRHWNEIQKKAEALSHAKKTTR